VRLAGFLAHVDAVVAPELAAASGRVAVELTVGLPGTVSLIDGGRDLDNYLFPVARRLGPERVAAIFGRKIHGPSSLAVGPAEPQEAVASTQFSTHMTGSYERKEWKQELRVRLLRARVVTVEPGPGGPARNRIRPHSSGMPSGRPDPAENGCRDGRLGDLSAAALQEDTVTVTFREDIS
jgi:hypothetical protein